MLASLLATIRPLLLLNIQQVERRDPAKIHGISSRLISSATPPTQSSIWTKDPFLRAVARCPACLLPAHLYNDGQETFDLEKQFRRKGK